MKTLETTKNNPSIGGLLLIDKAEGVTSRSVDNAIGRLFHTHKVGHLGTLDPFATGLLVVAVNKGTKFLPYLEDGEKTYVAELQLGAKTTTGDCLGEVVEEQSVPELSKEEIEASLKSMEGKQKQIPPMTSAKKVEGQALYKMAHKGIEIERKPIDIEILSTKLISYDNVNKRVIFAARVSKGTYMRTFGEDFSVRIGTIGYLKALRRTAIGSISVVEAKPIESVDEGSFLNPLSLMTGIEKVEIRQEFVKKAQDGVAINLENKSERIILVHEGKPIAIYRRKEGTLFVSERGLF